MPHGGKRTGSGRKVGAVTTKTREVADKIIAEGGVMPLDVMLKTMRFYDSGADAKLAELLAGNLPLPAEGEDTDSPITQAILDGMKDVLKLRACALDAADKAAPFLHARLAPVQGGQAKVEDEETPLVERLKRYATAEAIENSAGKVVPMKVSDRPAPTGKAKAKA